MAVQRLLDRTLIHRLLTNGTLANQLPWVVQLAAARPAGTGAGGCGCAGNKEKRKTENAFLDRVKDAIIGASEVDKNAIKAALGVRQLRVVKQSGETTIV